MMRTGDAIRFCDAMNLLLTGKPGVGKTTLVMKVAGALGNRAGGVITREVREGGKRRGFSIESLDGEKRILASTEFPGGPSVGRYRVSLENLEAVGIPALDRSLAERRVIIIDEIGKMELKSGAFRAIIIRALDSELPVVATIGISNTPFLQKIKRREDVLLVEVTAENRDELEQEVLRLINRESQDEK
jgi:nucleoside-triphosphatase